MSEKSIYEIAADILIAAMQKNLLLGVGKRLQTYDDLCKAYEKILTCLFARESK